MLYSIVTAEILLQWGRRIKLVPPNVSSGMINRQYSPDKKNKKINEKSKIIEQ